MYQESGNKSLLQSARQNFVKKVYATLSIQLLITVLVVYMSVKSPKFLKFLIKNYGLFWMSFIGSIITMIALCNFLTIKTLEISAENRQSIIL